jgi:hypothetical protein
MDRPPLVPAGKFSLTTNQGLGLANPYKEICSGM